MKNFFRVESIHDRLRARYLIAAQCTVGLLPSTQAVAATVVVEPVDCAPGTDPATISPYVTLHQVGGAPVHV